MKKEMSMKELMEEQEKIEEHQKNGTGVINVEFKTENNKISMNFHATASPAMLETLLRGLVRQLAKENKMGIVQFMADQTAQMMLQDQGY